ncbi:MAG: hypothetical protein QOJ40_2393 [Verrucomicrobiota bacterium]
MFRPDADSFTPGSVNLCATLFFRQHIYSMTAKSTPSSGGRRFLPRIGSPGYHVMLICVAIFILGPLGGISAAFMNFSIGFFIGGQVLAGILGSTVTLPYGPEGKHGANYMQTLAASVAGLCGMGVLLQAMVWLGWPEPAAWKLILYFLCIGMFGAGVGMLYTPLLVDRMQLAYPSGFAVANILRALTDKELLKRSIKKLGGGMLLGYVAGLASLKIAVIEATGLSAGTIGAGMIVGARIAIPALVVGLTGYGLTPYLRSLHWLGPEETYRKIGFIISMGTILGAAIFDITLILVQAARRLREQSLVKPAEDWKQVNTVRLVLWVIFWAAGTLIVGNRVMGQPVFFLAVALGLSLLFMLVNGISQGISDWNPISSAFVMTVFILVALSLHDPVTGLMSAAIVFVACNVGCDMQQDRSTGWRLGTNRVVQFRYQVIGVAMGAVLAVALAKLFMSQFPVLREDQFLSAHVEGAQKWQSAMTLKLVGVLRGITNPKPHVMTALKLGIGLGLFIEITRKLIKRTVGYKRFAAASRTGRATDFLIDAVLLASPYASSFGGFVELPAVLWWAGGGVGASLFEAAQARLASRPASSAEGELPSDMSTMSLVGGGLIAGDSLAALSIGIYQLLRTLL